MAKPAPKDRLSDVRRVHRQFLYLNGDEVISSLASLRGGDVDAVLETSLKATGGNAGIKFSLFGAGLNFGAKSSRQTRREVELKQTVHSAVTVLLQQLYEQDGVGRLRTIGDLEPAQEGLVVQFEARIELPKDWKPIPHELPLTQRLFRSKRARQVQALAEATNDGLVGIAELGPTADGDPDAALLSLREKYLLVGKPGDFGRRVTVVGQLETIAAAGSEELIVETDESGQHARLESIGASESDNRSAGGSGGEFTREMARAVVRPFCMFR